MRPAYSVIFFTTATGAGYGLLALLGLLGAVGTLPSDITLGLVGLGLAMALITGGLLSSTAHLGRPERAWRAFSQWRTSWLSREGIAAVATYLPAGLLGAGWVLLGRTDGWVAAAGVTTAILAALTVSATGMIYASLKPVAEWHTPFTLPAYLIFALMTGLVVLNALLACLGRWDPWWAGFAIAATLAGWAWKIATWWHNDTLRLPSSANTATGLTGGSVRSVEWPHTEENYLLKEMGYRIARKHSERLRLIAQAAAFALPIVLLLTAMMSGALASLIASVLAALLQLAGMLIERWLFFAEARHTVTLYYGR